MDDLVDSRAPSYLSGCNLLRLISAALYLMFVVGLSRAPMIAGLALWRTSVEFSRRELLYELQALVWVFGLAR